MSEKVIAVIPARMGAKRLPGKPMADILGMPMIGHVYHRAKMSLDFIEVFVATCDKEIADYVRSIGGEVIMTSRDHMRSTDRVAEAVRYIEDDYDLQPDIVVMVQGDEPLVTDQMVSNSISPLIIDPGVEVVSLMTEITDQDEINDSNSVKVVVDNNNFALYMSRSPIPYQKRGIEGLPVLKKVNVVAMRRDFLMHFSALPASTLELVESIGMLRLLECGINVKMVLSETYSVSVDTEKDLNIVRDLMKDDFWMGKYNQQ
ncbi:MAG: 3-deoxy-manno-octulosonate cytidylyltransferase [Bacteroidales bacterium]|nr:3-deoxy-manno-octulosonate cytidylyltransferase [Bacteroidales bacterium]